MKDTCSDCHETFNQENLTRCSCGQEYCYRCFPAHERKTGHEVPRSRWHGEVFEQTDEYLRDRLGGGRGKYYIYSPFVDGRGNLTMTVDLEGPPHNLEKIQVRISAEEIAAHPKLSRYAHGSLGDAIGEYLVQHLIQTYGLKPRERSSSENEAIVRMLRLPDSDEDSRG